MPAGKNLKIIASHELSHTNQSKTPGKIEMIANITRPQSHPPRTTPNIIHHHRSHSHHLLPTPKKAISCNTPVLTMLMRSSPISASPAIILSVPNAQFTDCTRIMRFRPLVKPLSRSGGFLLRTRQSWTKLPPICWQEEIAARNKAGIGVRKVENSKTMWRRSWQISETCLLRRRRNCWNRQKATMNVIANCCAKKAVHPISLLTKFQSLSATLTRHLRRKNWLFCRNSTSGTIRSMTFSTASSAKGKRTTTMSSRTLTEF